LQGQIDDYHNDYTEGVIVVLVGNMDKYIENILRARLQEKLDNWGGISLQPFRIKLINKTQSKLAERKKNQNLFDMI